MVIRVAVLDDWQAIARECTDWSALSARAEVTFFSAAFADEAATAAQLRDFDIVLSMRERTPLPGSLISRLERLKMLGITGPRNASLDSDACTARYGQALGMKVLAWSQNLTAATAAAAGAELVTKEALFARADAISVHLVLSARSRHIIGAAEIGRMKPGAVLVNTSRGPLIDEDALALALAERRIFAGLDVFDREPLPANDRLRQLPNTVLTPHLGYTVVETMRHFYAQSVENALAFLDGRPIRVTNPQALGR
jgi:phosphoglycerate dehydrogenase-like enzyme